MSMEMVQSFIHKIGADTDFRSRFAGFGDDTSALIAAAVQAGYSFTAEEYRAALAGELAEGDLSAISGGFGDGSVMPSRPAAQISGNSNTVQGNSPVNNEFTGGVRHSLPAVQRPG